MFILCIVNIGVAFEKLLPINDMEKNKNKKQKTLPHGRPNKFEAFARVMGEMFATQDWNAWVVACTDEELLFMVNQKLPEEQRVSDRSWREYKAGSLPTSNVDYRCVDVFFASYKKALIGQKHIIMDNLSGDTPGAWQKWAWILERKFEEFNQRTKTVDETPDVRRLVLRVSEKG
jgi:hypothetical protein